jgi:MoaA/NifB/PqqE/SkfB family radical SAM enzyme
MTYRGVKSLEEMSPDTLASVVEQATVLGVSVIVIAGGEPLMRVDEILRMAKTFPEILFPVFTNGLLINETIAEKIAGCRNVVPVISFEGFRQDTDLRRGKGVYGQLLATCSLLKTKGVFFGCSVTTTRENFQHVMAEAFIREMIKIGARVFTFVEYVPMEPGTENLVLTLEQKKTLNSALLAFSQTFPALFIGFPGDEEAFGGCLAAGRGFVHISPSGDLEPCPAAALSDVNLVHTPLEEALRSRLLSRIRDEHGLLTESVGGCALRANPEWVQRMLSGSR